MNQDWPEPPPTPALPPPRPNRGLLDSTIIYRINSTASIISDAFNGARIAARSEALWLSAVCRSLLADNDKLRIENEKLKSQLERPKHD